MRHLTLVVLAAHWHCSASSATCSLASLDSPPPAPAALLVANRYKALFRANYEWFRDEGKAFSYFRATTHGITMNLYCCTKMGDLLDYLAHICRAMIEVEKESYKGIMVHPYGGPHASPTNGRLLFADHAAKDQV